MAIAEKLVQVNQVKQDIKTAIETKGIPMTNVAFTEYANKILEISSGGEVDEYYYYAKSYYTITNNATLFSNAWQDSENSKTVLYGIPLMLAATEQEFFDGTADFYAGTDGSLAQLYNDCLNGVITPTVDLEGEGVPNEDGFIYLVNNSPLLYVGDYGSLMGYPVPVYVFGMEALMSLLGLPYDETATDFMVADMTSLEMGLGVVLIRQSGKSIPNNKVLFQQGVKFENENGIILPNSVTSIGNNAFRNWTSNNQPLVIPDSVTSIGEEAFANWYVNNQPLVIPNSVTIIGDYAFASWTSNNQPLVIPNSVTSIGEEAFANWYVNNQPLVIPESVTSIGNNAFWRWELVPYVEVQAIIPPSLANSNAFGDQNYTPIYVPDASLDDYKTATNWVKLASRIFPISSKP